MREIIHVTKPYKLVSREFSPEDSVIDVKGVRIGGDEFVVMAGPCSVESREQTMIIAEAGGQGRRPPSCGEERTNRAQSPYSFQGMKEDGLKILAEARDKFDLAHSHRGDRYRHD